jgi:ATP-dependent DNA helicase RecQ
MLWSAGDFTRARERLAELPEERRDAERVRIDALSRLVETHGCRRALLLRHFGEDPAETCGNCDNCLEAPAVKDATELAQKLLSAVFRTGQMFGVGHLEKVLTGKSDERVLKFSHDQLSVFGIVEEPDASALKTLARALQARGSLVANEHGGLKLAGDARSIMRGEKKVEIALVATGRKRRERGGDNPLGDPLFDALRAKRRELADTAGVPPYVIFHDSTLRDMAMLKPQNRSDMALVNGVGARKLDAYGDAFLDVVRQFRIVA